MNETGAAGLMLFVKMKPTLQKMYAIDDGNHNIGVEMNETGKEMKDHEQMLVDGFPF
jgi:hypothetical protein